MNPIFVDTWIDANYPQFALAKSFESVIVRMLQQRFLTIKPASAPTVDVVVSETVDEIHPTVKVPCTDQLAEILVETGLLARSACVPSYM